MVWVVLLVAAAAAVVVVVVVRNRRRREPGMTDFRRHIDALSPQARREVADRVRRSLDDGQDR
jgi:hypothetical protein